jgi:hypothetical protein
MRALLSVLPLASAPTRSPAATYAEYPSTLERPQAAPPVQDVRRVKYYVMSAPPAARRVSMEDGAAAAQQESKLTWLGFTKTNSSRWACIIAVAAVIAVVVRYNRCSRCNRYSRCSRYGRCHA